MKLKYKGRFYFGSYLNKGFRIKIEEISDQQLQEVIRFLEKKITISILFIIS
jgi:hypothetical protein